jgi:NAD(P)-dependent dehydrogenase (short-subunit alcohol dehydrogenase family)
LVRRTALVTGGSRGIGAATVHALAAGGFAVAFTYRSKARRAEQVVADARGLGTDVLAIRGDMTVAAELAEAFVKVRQWTDHLDVVVLNASGGLERDRLAEDPDYPMRINRDAQLAAIDHALPLLPAGASVVLVTSHWAHLYGRIEQLPAYEPVARTKHAGEEALRQHEGLRERGIRLLVVTGDLVDGTVTPMLLERAARGMTDERRREIGGLPTADDLAEAIAAAAVDPSLPWGHTVVVGGALDTVT